MLKLSWAPIFRRFKRARARNLAWPAMANAEAARQGRTMSELVETALRTLFRSQRKPRELPSLPTFRSGGALVDHRRPRRALFGHGRTMSPGSSSTPISSSTPPTPIRPGAQRRALGFSGLSTEQAT